MKTIKPESNSYQWFVIKTKYKCEKYVRVELSKKGIEAYVPLQHVVRMYKSKKRKLAIPIISGYVFVKINQEHYLQVLQTQYVYDFIRFGGRTIPISEAEIDILKRFEGYNLPSRVEDSFFHSGEDVQISYGPLVGLKGSLLEQTGKQKYIVELHVFEKSLFVEVNAGQLEIIQNTKKTNGQ